MKGGCEVEAPPAFSHLSKAAMAVNRSVTVSRVHGTRS